MARQHRLGLPTEICRALGLDPNETTSIVLKLLPGEPVTVEIVRIVTDAETGEISERLSQYQLVAKEELSAKEVQSPG